MNNRSIANYVRLKDQENKDRQDRVNRLHKKYEDFKQVDIYSTSKYNPVPEYVMPELAKYGMYPKDLCIQITDPHHFFGGSGGVRIYCGDSIIYSPAYGICNHEFISEFKNLKSTKIKRFFERLFA